MVRKKHLLLSVVLLVAGAFYLYGRALWYPMMVKFTGGKTEAEVLAIYGADARARLSPQFDLAGISYPPRSITLLAIKQSGTLELWVNDTSPPTYITTYTIEAQSGTAGPKLREGDRQVPEGLYRIVGLNPNSSFHLSMKLNYPNAFDIQHAAVEGRDEPGSNIFIHGKASSVGCLAMGDPAIEELFTLVSDVGVKNASVIIAPTDPRPALLQRVASLPWTDKLYREIEQAFQPFKHDIR